ncbi:DUF418 domain-containing protein [Streptomyces sp. 796.1]|uniref:DUF418 domain-containing protein n=1 Tax=Streptomyces sp. 796.1 TaxID=3163029 RepID=UPI0039C95901
MANSTRAAAEGDPPRPAGDGTGADAGVGVRPGATSGAAGCTRVDTGDGAGAGTGVAAGARGDLGTSSSPDAESAAEPDADPGSAPEPTTTPAPEPPTSTTPAPIAESGTSTRTPRPGPVVEVGGAPSRAGAGGGAVRLVGLDLARGLAVFGMYAAHLGPEPELGEPSGFLLELAHGRSSALFAVLAGVTLVFLAGRQPPSDARDGRRAALRIAIRALVLLAFGSVLTASGTKVEVILAYYGLYFLLALPFVRLTSRALAALAVGWALVGPQLWYMAQQVFWDSALERGIAAHDPLAHYAEGEGLTRLLVTGNYPALAWMPFVLAGMAVGRLDLRAPRVRARLAVLGPALAAFGYGASWLALQVPAVGDRAGMPHGWWADTDEWPEDLNPGLLLLAAPHSETTLSVVANTGVALTVVAAALTAMDLLPRLRPAAVPVIAVGSMSLSSYVFHIVGIRLLHIDIEGDDLSIGLLLGFIAAVSLSAYAWSRFFRRGPLEFVLHHLSLLGRRRR